MIAEFVMSTEDEQYEAMDLFRHATELQFHVRLLLSFIGLFHKKSLVPGSRYQLKIPRGSCKSRWNSRGFC